MIFGLRLNWHYNPVADISNPLLHKLQKYLPVYGVLNNSRIIELETGNGNLSYGGTRKEGKQRVINGTTTEKFPT
jgi:hypothetical protein